MPAPVAVKPCTSGAANAVFASAPEASAVISSVPPSKTTSTCFSSVAPVLSDSMREVWTFEPAVTRSVPHAPFSKRRPCQLFPAPAVYVALSRAPFVSVTAKSR